MRVKPVKNIGNNQDIMYAENFGFRKLPFENVPDPAFFFNQGDYARVLNGITESLKKGMGLMVVTGPEGAGKTTLSQMIISDFSGDIRIVWIAEPPGKCKDLFLFIAQELGLRPAASDRASVLRGIKEALLRINSDGSRYLVIIEDAHIMTEDTVEGLCLLNDLRKGPAALIQILLFAQETIVGMINRPEIKPFRKRIAFMVNIGKMDAGRIRKYVLHRIEVAGGRPSVFSDTAWKALSLAFASGNTPRTINSLCDRSLTMAFKKGRTIVSVDDIYKAAEEVEIYREDVYCEIKPEKSAAEEYSDNLQIMDIKKSGGPEVSDIEGDNFLKQGAALPSSEWVTSDMKGPKSFIPLNAVDTKPAEEIRSIEKFNKWVAMDEKKPAVFRKPDGNKRKDEEEWELYTSFDRVAAGSKGTGSFKPSDSKGLRPSGRTKARVKSDEWVRAGRKNYWINRNIYYGKDIVRHE